MPFVILAVLYVWLMVCVLHRPEVKEIRFSTQAASLSMPPLTVERIFVVTVLEWLTTRFTGLMAPTVAVVPIILIYSPGLLDATNIGQINWATLLLFGGGLLLWSKLTAANIDALMAE